MKKLLTILIAVFLSVHIFAQSSPTLDLRIANATTAFGQNLPIGTKVFNVDTGLYYVATAGVLSTATLTSAAASFDPIITRVWATAPIRSSGGGRPVITIQPASVDSAGSLSAPDKVRLNNVRLIQNHDSLSALDERKFQSLTDTVTWGLGLSQLGHVTKVDTAHAQILSRLRASHEYVAKNDSSKYYEKLANKSTNVTTDGASDIKYPSAKAVKTLADTKVAKESGKALPDNNFTDADSAAVVNLTATLAAADTLNVHKAGTQTITGKKTFSNIAALTTSAESWIGPSSTTGVYFKGGNVGIGTTAPSDLLHLVGRNSIRIGTNDATGEYFRMTKFDGGTYIDTYENSGDAVAGYGLISFRNNGSKSTGLANGGFSFGHTDGTNFVRILNNGNVGIGTTNPTSKLHLAAGTATAGTAPLGFTSGALLTTPVVGIVEFLTDAWYGTITTGTARKTFAFLESPTFTGTVTIPLLNFSKSGYGAYKAMISDASGNIAYSRALGTSAYKDSTYFQTNLTSPVAGMIGTGDRLVYTTAAGVLTPTAITLSGGILNYGGTKTFSNAFDLVSREYVDATTTGLAPKLPCDLATTTGQNLDLVGVETIDGTATTSGTTRVLVKNQTTVAQNGVYIAQAGAWTRSTDLDTWAELYKAYVVVSGGSTNVGTSWICTIPSSGTLEVTDVTWQQFGIANTITAGIGLTRTGDDIHANVDETTLTISTDTIRLKAMTSAIFGAKISDKTGTDKLVYNTDANLVTPILGTPQSGNFSTGSFTWPTFNQSTTGTAAGLTAAYIDYNSSSGGNSILNKPDLTIYHLKDDSLKRHTNLTTTAHGGIVALADSANGSGADAKWVTGKAFNTHAALNATTSTNGHLSSTDWNTFNNKQPAGSYLVAADITGKLAIADSSGIGGSGAAGKYATGKGLQSHVALTTTAHGLNTWAGTTNITTLGTITTGTWNGSVVAGQYGGTGIANTGKTITIGGNFSTVGAYTAAFTMTANTAVTFPTSGTLATTSQLTGAIVYICESFEIPADGSTGSTVTLGHTPLNVSGVTVSQNGAELKYTDQFTVSGTTVTFAKQVYTYDKITCSYSY
jgi:hypothetical protein